MSLRPFRLRVRSAPWRPRVLAVALIASLTVILSGCGPFADDYAFQGGELPPPNPAPALALTDQHGQAFDLASQRGRAVLLFFGYTHCPDICPTTLSDFLAVKEALGDQADEVAFVFVTVDPARDSPERLRQYLDFFDPGFIGLTGTDEQIAQAKQGYGVYSRIQESTSSLGYLVDHTSALFAIDPDGNYRLTYAYGTDPAIVAEDVSHLLDA